LTLKIDPPWDIILSVGITPKQAGGKGDDLGGEDKRSPAVKVC